MYRSTLSVFAALSLWTALGASPADAAMTLSDPGLPGAKQFDEFTNASLTSTANPGYPGFPGGGAWPAPIQSALGGDATFNKAVMNPTFGPYPASGSIYNGGFSAVPNTPSTALAVSDASPVASLKNVVFQIQIGEATGWDFFNDALPTLSYNGGAQNLVATTARLLEAFPNGTFAPPVGPPETLYINTYALQWDLTSIVGPITDFNVRFTGAQHSQIYTMRLDQSDTLAALALAAAPEPANFTLVGLALGGLAWRKRRAKAATRLAN